MTIVNPDAMLEVDTLLASVPMRNQSIVWDPYGDAGSVARVPVRKKWYMKPPLSWIMPFSEYRRVALDALGREVLDMCNGVATIEEIVDRFGAAHHLRFHQARLSVMEFLRQLTRRGLIVVVGPKKEEKTP